MGKFAFALLTAFFFEFALWMFAGPSYEQTSLFNLIVNPTSILSNLLYLAIVAAIGVFTISQIIPGNFLQINTYGIYAKVAAVILTFSASIVHLYQFVYGNISGISETFALPITIIFVAPFLIFYVISTFEWIRSN